MIDRVQRLEQLVELARGLARDDFALHEMCRRMHAYVGDLVDLNVFYVAIADENGVLHPEYYAASNGEAGLEEPPKTEDLTRLPLRHGERDLGAVFTDASLQSLDAVQPDLGTAVDFLSLAIASVHKLRATERRIDRDNLTNLYNRNYGLRRLQEELVRASRSKANVCTLIVDIDGVADLNTRYGHQTGDSAIRTVADALKSICRHSDVLCRYAGDRFLLIYPDFAGTDAGPVARRVRTQIEARVLPVPGGAIGLKASIGAAIAHDHADANALVQQTERELMRDKNERHRRV